MSDAKDKIERMIFNRETTYRTDYNASEIKDLTFTTYKKKPTCYMIRPPPLKDLHTLSNWKETPAPFSLHNRPKDITATNPMDTQKSYIKKQATADDDEVKKTRPRLVMTPAVSMDDIEDPTARAVLCNAMYTSEMTRATHEAVANVAPYFSVKAPLPDHYSPSNPITLEKLRPPMVQPEWRMESITWDQKQLRAHCDTTKDFWLKQELIRCRACEETAVVVAHRKMQSLVKKR